MKHSVVTHFLHDLYKAVQEDDISSLGAQLSYYLILSIFPFLIFLIAILDYTPLTQQNTIDELSYLLPVFAFTVIRGILLEVAEANSFSLLTLGILGTAWSASRSTAVLVKAISRAYKIKESRSFFKLNAIGIASIFALALIIILSLSLLVFGRYIGSLAFHFTGMQAIILTMWPFIRFGIPLLIIFGMLSLIYLFAPDTRLCFRNIYPGAVFSTLAWLTASLLFSYYVDNFDSFTRTYGSLGGIVIFLIWLYLSSLIVLLGAEINAVLHRTTTDKLRKKAQM